MSESVFQAAARGDVRMLRLLIRKGHMDDADDEGNTPLMIATRCNRPQAVAILLERQANVNQVNAHGDGALHIAAQKGIMHVSIIRMLIEAGANVTSQNADRESPVSLIAKNTKLARHPTIAPLLEKRLAANRLRRKSTMRLSSMGRYQKQVEQLQKKKKENALNVYSRAEDMTSFKQIWEILTRSPAESSTTLAAETLTPFFNLLGASLSPPETAALFDLLDDDQDGSVDFSDFYMSMMWRKPPDALESAAIDLPFEVLDSCAGTQDPTGIIAKSSYKAAQRALGPVFFADSERDTFRILSSLVPGYANAVRLDTHAGIDRKLFLRIVSGRAELQLRKPAQTQGAPQAQSSSIQ